MVKLDRITMDLYRMNGEPCIKGTKITVRRVLQALATYPSRAEILREYPELEEADILQSIEFAAAHLANYDLECVLQLPDAA